jgi:arylsulfate sulfotransferase
VKSNGSVVAVPEVHFIRPKWHLPYQAIGYSKNENDFYYYQGRSAVIMNHYGYVKHWIQEENNIQNFRRYENKLGQNRYVYTVQVHDTPMPKGNAGYWLCELVVLDENFKEIDRQRIKASGRIKDDYPMENHDYVYIDDGHYMIPTAYPNTVDNIPNVNGSYKVFNNVIQEVKNSQVVFHWESIDYPELFKLSHYLNDPADCPSTGEKYLDYAHINSMFIDERDQNLLVSFRHIGIVKIDRQTGAILWMLAKNRCDIKGIDENMIPSMQHDARYNYDHSITLFDDSGSTTDNARVMRYWIDEKKLTAIKVKEYVCPYGKSQSQGSATLIDEENEIFDIAYGGGHPNISFHEYSFKYNKELMFVNLPTQETSVVYRVFRDNKGTQKRNKD